MIKCTTSIVIVFFIQHKKSKTNEVIVIILEYEKAEEEYVSSTLSYAALSHKYGIPISMLSKYAKNNNWVEKRRKRNSPDGMPSLDVSKLARSSDALETIIENAFMSVSESSSENNSVDTKTLKDLTSTLKEAINIKQNIYLLPMLTEQKQLELEQKKSPITLPSENEITVVLENDTEKYCM